MKYLNKLITVLGLGLALTSQAGRLQNEDFKTPAQITAAGGSISQLLNTTNIYDTTNSQQLSSSIANGQLGGGGGSKNYLSSYVPSLNPSTANTGNGNFEKNATTGWTPTTVGLTGIIPTGTPSSTASSITTFATTSTNPLEGKYSLSVVSTGAITAGQGFISTPFYIDSEDQTGVFSVGFSYSVVSGAANISFNPTSVPYTGTFAVYAYDVTNATWIQPDKVYGLDGSGLFSATFQASKTGAQYQLAVLAVNASSGASSMLFDAFTFGPQSKNSGSNVIRSSAQLNTNQSLPSGTATKVTFTTVVVDKNAAFSVANNRYIAQQSGSYQINPSMFFLSGSSASIITVALYKNGSAYRSVVSNISGATTYLSVTPSWTDEANVGDYYEVWVTAGSSGVVAASGSEFDVQKLGNSSSGDDGKIVRSTMNNTGSQSIGTSATKVAFNNILADKNAAMSTSNSRYTVQQAGSYTVTASVWGAPSVATNGSVYLYKNGSQYRQAVAQLGGGSGGTFSWDDDAQVGDYYEIWMAVNSGTFTVYTTSNLTAGSTFDVKRLSGPSTLGAAQGISAHYHGVNSGSVTNTDTVGAYTTVDWDTVNAYNPTTGVYTCKVAGKYQINAAVAMLATWASGNQCRINIFKNGAAFTQNTMITPANNLAVTWMSDLVQCNVGETISIAWGSTASGTTLATSSSSNYFSITRVGN